MRAVFVCTSMGEDREVGEENDENEREGERERPGGRGKERENMGGWGGRRGHSEGLRDPREMLFDTGNRSVARYEIT